MTVPFVLATSCAAPDVEFPSLRALAQAVVSRRDALPARPGLHLVTAQIARGALPGGACVAIRALDGSAAGKGVALGYAFVPAESRAGGGRPAERLMSAILELDPAPAKAAAAPAEGIAA